MWKYISRSFRTPFDRGTWPNLTCSAASDQNRANVLAKEGKLQVPCPFRFVPSFLEACQRHLSHLGVQGGSSHGQEGHSNKESSRKSKSDHSNIHIQPCPLIGAIGWSGVLVLGWTILQPWCRRGERRRPPQDSQVNEDAVKRYNCLYKLLFHSVLSQPIGNAVLPSPIPIPNERSVSPSSSSPLSSTSQSHSKTIEQLFDEAADEVRRVHEEAIGEAENRLGVSCLAHMKNDEAVEHFRVASSFNHASAAFNLGQCYELGIGTQQNLVQAVEQYQIASDRGHPVATYNLGVFYAHGQGGLKVDLWKARNLFMMAASRGQPDAIAALKMEKRPETDLRAPLKSIDNSFESRLAMDFYKFHNIGLRFTREEPDLEETVRHFNGLASSYSTSGQSSSTSSLPSSPTSLSSQWSSPDLIDHHNVSSSDDSSEVISDTCSDEWQAAVDLVTLNGNSATLYKLAVCYENNHKVDPDILLKLYRMAADHGHAAAKRRLATLEEHYLLGTLDDYIRMNKQGLKQSTVDCTYQK